MSRDSFGVPIAFLITFRTYGTWLHGDTRGSVDRYHNAFGTALIPANPRWRAYEQSTLIRTPVVLGSDRRRATDAAIRETCDLRRWHLNALNVRTNHVHAVISARTRPERIVGALKANATRTMRSRGCWRSECSPWSDGGSTRYIWTEHGLERAIAYVLDGQGARLD